MKTLTVLSQDYFAWAQVMRAGRPISRCTRGKVGRFVRWLEEALEVRFAPDLTPEVTQRWLKSESARPHFRSGLPLHARTLQTTFFKVLPFCQWLADTGHVARTVPEAFPKLRPIPIQIKPALPHRAMRRLLERIPMATAVGYRNRALGEFLYTSGVRIAEALAMNLEDVDLDNGTARIHGKGNKNRVVPIGARGRHHLRIYLKSIRPMLLRTASEHAVWINRRGTRVRYQRFYREWREMLKAMELPIAVTAHTFRRSCATELHRNGASPAAIRELLGHRYFHTLKHYLDIRIADLKRTHARCHPRDREADHQLA